MQNVIIVRGGGDIATGCIYKLVRSGFPVLVLETAHPSAIRRNAAFSEAVYDGISRVEDMECRLARSPKEAVSFLSGYGLTMLVDEKVDILRQVRPLALVDAILAKKNLGTRMDMAPLTIGLGPGFTAGKDVHAVIETMRGHRLGRILWEGCALPNTGVPGRIAGVDRERVIHAPAAGIFVNRKRITETVRAGEVIAVIERDGEVCEVKASVDGLLRGLLRDGYPVTKGFKVADIDPRISEYENCFTISDKARCIAGGVLEAVTAQLTGSGEWQGPGGFECRPGESVGVAGYRSGESAVVPMRGPGESAAVPVRGPGESAAVPVRGPGESAAVPVRGPGGIAGDAGYRSDEASRPPSSRNEIYADHAATGRNRPEAVSVAIAEALRQSGSPGRGVHEASLFAARTVFACRRELARLFGADRPEQIVFTANATEALNIALKGLIRPGDHVVTTVMEHNSVLRPLYELEERGAQLTVISCQSQGVLELQELKCAVTRDTRAVVCTHASNVTGNRNPIRQIGEICEANGCLFLVDASQTAGVFPLDMKRDHISVLAFTGHKGLLGPQGTGGLCVGEGVNISGWKSGGSGTHSFDRTQPQSMPEALEAGTPNVHGISGLLAGVRYIREYGMDRIRDREQQLCFYFWDRISRLPGLSIYGDFTDRNRAAIVSLNVGKIDSGRIADVLAEHYFIATRAGAHCAPLMHEHFGTREQGMVRFSFSHTNTFGEIDSICRALEELTAATGKEPDAW